MLPVLGSEVVIDLVAYCDTLLYQVICNVLITSPLQNLPERYTNGALKFSLNLTTFNYSETSMCLSVHLLFIYFVCLFIVWRVSIDGSQTCSGSGWKWLSKGYLRVYKKRNIKVINNYNK